MELTNDFEVGVPVERAWEILTDVERIAPCLPGAKLEEIEGDEYRGIVKVKVGPITAEYRGAARFVEKDDTQHVAKLDASGRDTRGQGNANATITATMQEVGSRTQVHVVTDLNVTGKVAQFGRGVMVEVSSKLMQQFAENLERTVLRAGEADVRTAGDGVPPSVDGKDKEHSLDEASVVEEVKKAQSANMAAKSAAKKTAKKAKKTTKKAAKKETQTTAKKETQTTAKKTTKKSIAKKPESGEPESGEPESGKPESGKPESGEPESESAARSVRKVDSPEPEPVDLLEAAGTSVAKRLIPLVVVMLLIVLVVRWLRRRRAD